MDFALSKQQQALQERAREAVDRVVVPIANEAAEGGILTRDQVSRIYQGLAPTGYLGSTISPDEGGAGLSFLDYGLLLEAFGASPFLLGEVVPPRLIARVGTPEQKKRWLAKLLSGELVATAAITEPQAGSDTRGFTCEGVPGPDSYRITGKKKWIKFGGIADLMALMVVEPGLPAKARHTRIIVERDVTPWESREVRSVGIRNVSFVELEFKGAEVPRTNLISKPGEALQAFGRGIEASRPFIGLTAIGIASHALDLATRYTRDRVAFGRPIAKFQAIQVALADAAMEIAAARLLCLQALWMMDNELHAAREASMSKVLATEASVRACNAAMDVMGAMGLSEEAGVERCWRDCRMLTVIDGTSGINRLIAGREITGHPAFI
jgi:alkylation response protein AidB-like acyl-CoA dehydrogenase